MSLKDQFQQAYISFNQTHNEQCQVQLAAASMIQATYRASLTRKNYRLVASAALSIQSTFRKFKTVKHTQLIYNAVQYQKRLTFYNQNAIRIQKLWRGKVVRKHILNIKQRKQNIASYTLQAAYQVDYCKQHYKICEDIENQNEFEKVAKLRQEMGKIHYLASTKAIPGVFKACYPKIQPSLGGKEIDLIISEQGRIDARKGVKTLQKKPVQVLENSGILYYK
ncbi:hypothetical protein SS50377_20571 [Spironucleus salmonicida]|uniref:IQ calmodulin-binding motif-containing protein n=1 Tax=Spironucleus salmonicida TaxID=348837 RepID=V6LWU9_9EUKA|nr:hypothetical protein SS50377_20571 [Spironucleus salmonicida]|eukprot:EST48171.1 hypothetical protein SS50377_11689 [Spironucleus salmonicida]